MEGTHPPEISDITLHPLQDLSLVQESIIGRNVVPIGQKAVRTNAVVEGDNNDIVPRGIDEACAVVIGIAVDIEAATLYEDKDRQLRSLGRIRGRVYVKKQTVLRCGSIGRRCVCCKAVLSMLHRLLSICVSLYRHPPTFINIPVTHKYGPGSPVAVCSKPEGLGEAGSEDPPEEAPRTVSRAILSRQSHPSALCRYMLSSPSRRSHPLLRFGAVRLQGKPSEQASQQKA